MPIGFGEWQQEHGNRILADALKTVEETTEQAGPPRVDSELIGAAVIPTLVDLSKEATMIVVACRGRGELTSRLLGSVASALVHHADCPVAVIHDEDPLMPHPAQAPVLVGIDGSPASELATDIAFDEASRRGVDLVAMHAWSDAGEPEFPGMDFSTIDLAKAKSWPSVWRDGKSAIPMSRCTVTSSVIGRLISSSSSPSLRNSLSSAVTAAVGSRECCWAVSARLWCSQCVCR